MSVHQLAMFDENLNPLVVQCPHCGHEFDVRPQLEARRRVLNDPRVQALPRGPRRLLELAPDAFIVGHTMGPSQIADWVGYDESTVRGHFRILAKRALIKRLPKGKGRGKHQYRLAI